MWFYTEEKQFGERMLWMAVVRRAVFDYVLWKGRATHNIEWAAAASFLFDDDPDADEGLNFLQICGVFAWDIDYMRRVIRELDRTAIKKMEVASFRDDYDDDTIIDELTRSVSWESDGVGVPRFPPFHYAPDYRAVVTPQRVAHERLPPVCSPLSHRAVAA